jgi:hypothetical protein
MYDYLTGTFVVVLQFALYGSGCEHFEILLEGRVRTLGRSKSMFRGLAATNFKFEVQSTLVLLFSSLHLVPLLPSRLVPFFTIASHVDDMAGSSARSVDSSMFIDDDDPTITLGGLANSNLEPQLVNQSPIASLAIKPDLTIDEVTAGQAVSLGALPPFLPSDTGKLILLCETERTLTVI